MDFTVKITIFFIIGLTTEIRSQSNGSPCKVSWKYDKHTDTCMSFFENKVSYSDANRTCSSYFGGPSKNQRGWLVGIYDEPTDHFVQTLFGRSGGEAFIGLSKTKDGWVWTGNVPPAASTSFRRWDRSSSVSANDNSHNKVITTNTGWKAVTNSARHSFVCQMKPFFPVPFITCPPSEKGKPLSPIECTVSFNEIYGSLSLIKVSSSIVSPTVICYSRKCNPLISTVTANILKGNEQWKVTVMAQNRPRGNVDDTWSCSAKFSMTDMSSSPICKRHTYVLPKTVECVHKYYAENGVEIECRVNKVFPKAKSIWTHAINSRQQTRLQPQEKHNSFSDKGQLMYKSIFTSKVSALGDHTLEIMVFPDVPFSSKEGQVKASSKRKVQFTISAPPEPPVFTLRNECVIQDRLTVEQGKTVTVVCEVSGGMPPVKKTTIECDHSYVKDSNGRSSWSDSDSKVSATLFITKNMDQKTCKCSANHVTGSYKKNKSFTFSIPHKAEIISFKVNEVSRNETEVGVGASVSFKCEARGNPKPQFSLYKRDGENKIQLDLGKSPNTFVIANTACEDSGTYEYRVENSLNPEPAVRRVILRVKCPPQPCSNKIGDREFSVKPGKEALNFTMCIFAYPNPLTDIRISRFSMTDKRSHNLDGVKYRANYRNINSVKTKGDVSIYMSPEETQLGNYTVDFYISSKLERIEFRLVPFQGPSCPRTLKVFSVGSSFITVSWESAFDRGIPQVFTLIKINAEDGVQDKIDIEDNKEETIYYNSTGLNPNTQFRFKLSVRNNEDTVNCPHLTVNVTTKVPHTSQHTSGDNVGVAVGIVFIIIILVAIIIIAIVVFLRRRGNKDNSKNQLSPAASAAYHRRDTDESKDVLLSSEYQKMGDSQNIGDLYATVNKPSSKVEKVGDSQNSGDLCATVNKPNKSAVSKADYIYSNDIAMETRDGQKRSKLNPKETKAVNQANTTVDGSLYANSQGLGSQNTPTLDSTSCDDAKKGHGKSSKNKKSSKGKKDYDKSKSPSINKDNLSNDNQRTNERQNKELVYVEVQIMPGQEKIKIKEEETQQPVQYASINFQTEP